MCATPLPPLLRRVELVAKRVCVTSFTSLWGRGGHVTYFEGIVDDISKSAVGYIDGLSLVTEAILHIHLTYNTYVTLCILLVAYVGLHMYSRLVIAQSYVINSRSIIILNV